MTSSLELRGVSYSHPGAPARTLDAVSLQVASGEMLAVLGPSGSGKTTLLRLTAGLVTPAEGDVFVGGRSVLAEPPERRGLTMMFQQPHLFPHLDVLGNVAFADVVSGVPRRAARERAQRFLDLVHLRDLARRRPRELSGGQEQRVALARALAARPEVLLLDEPFSALDPELRSAMHDLLLEVRAMLEPTTLIVTHDLAEAALADRVAVVVDGRIEQVGPVDDLYREPATLTVARLVGGFTEVPGRLSGGVHSSVLGAVEVRGSRHGQPADGPAALLVRQESVEVVPAADARTGATGIVGRLSRSGARLVAHVEVAACSGHPGVTVRAELPPGRRVAPGARVGLLVAAACACVQAPTPQPAGTAGLATFSQSSEAPSGGTSAR